MIAPGSVLLNFVVGKKIGAGTFGEVYTVKDMTNGEISAIKVESVEAPKRCLEHEFKILAKLQSSILFPRLGVYGIAPKFSFYSMEILGMSISAIVKKQPAKKIPLSSGLVVIESTLRALEQMHTFGLIHRDIKPANIITRNKKDCPICLIDFGLTRFYVDTKTGKHLPHKENAGFRGSKAYASINAHKFCSLSRKDDLISWFYVMIELICGKLPWRGMHDHNELIYQKGKFDVKKFVQSTAPEMSDIWTLINSLGFDEKPDYKAMYEKIDEIKKRIRVSSNERMVWDCYFANNLLKSESFLKFQVIEGVSEVSLDEQLIDEHSEEFETKKGSCRI